jgi:hypothetical protein
MRGSKSDAVRAYKHVAYKRVREVPNAFNLVGCPGAHRIVRVKSLAANGSGKEVCGTKSARVSFLYTVLFTSPTLTHSAAFTPSETSGVRGATSQANAETMRQLVDNDASLEIAIAVRVRRLPDVHPAPTVLSVWWGHKVCVIEPGSVLGICNDGVSFRSTTSKVMLLEVAGKFVEAITEYHDTLGHIEVNKTITARTGNRDRALGWKCRKVV